MWWGRCHHIHEWIMNYIIGCDRLPLRDVGNRHFIVVFPEMSQASLIPRVFNELVYGCCLSLFCINDAHKTFHKPFYFLLLSCSFDFKILSDGLRSFSYNTVQRINNTF